MIFQDCTFEAPVTVVDAELELLHFRSCVLSVFEGRNLQVSRDLSFLHVTAQRISLFGAHVGGQLWLEGSVIQNADEDSFAIDAPSVHVAGGLFGSRISVEGGFNLWGARMGTSLELDSAMLVNARGAALRAPHIETGLDVDMTSSRVEGEIDLFGAKVGGQLWLNELTADRRSGDWAINAASAVIGTGCYANGSTITGGFNLWGTDIRLASNLT